MDFRVTNAYSVQKLYAAQKTQAVKKSTPLTAQSGDTYSISAEAGEFHTALRAAMAAPDTRIDMVDYFTKQIESGAYHVPPHSIAAKLLNGVG